MRTPGRTSPAVSAVISSSGVLPIRSRTLWALATGTVSRSASAGNRWNDGDVVAILDLGVELIKEPDVVAVEVDVDEAAQVALAVEQPLAHPGMARFQVVDHGLDGVAGCRDFGIAAGEFPQW